MFVCTVRVYVTGWYDEKMVRSINSGNFMINDSQLRLLLFVCSIVCTECRLLLCVSMDW